MKIRPGQVTGPRNPTSTPRVPANNDRFQVLLDHQLSDAVEKQPDLMPPDRDASGQSYRLIGDATRLLDDAIAQIETSDTPQQETIASLQQLRNELAGLGHSDPALNDAEVILSVEAERLKSW